MLMLPATAVAQSDAEDDGFLNDDTVDILKSFQEETGFRSFSGGVEGQSDAKGLDSLTGVVITITQILQYVVGGFATIFLIITIVKLVAAADKAEEESQKLKKQLSYTIMAIILVLSIGFFIENALTITGGETFLESEDAARKAAIAGAGEIRGIYNFIEAFVAVLAVLGLVISGFRMVANAGNEETVTKAKKHLMYAAAGLIVVGVSELLVKGIIFKDAGTTIDVDRGNQLIVELTNFASGFIATLAVLSFFYAGYLYVFGVVSEENTQKVKKIIIGAVVGIIIAGGAFGIVNTVVELDSSQSPDFVEDRLDAIE